MERDFYINNCFHFKYWYNIKNIKNKKVRNFTIRIYTKLFCKAVGHDIAGNVYYENKAKGWFGSKKRCVLYKSEGIHAMPKIDVSWFNWMHYRTDKVPSRIKKNYQWEKNSTIVDYDLQKVINKNIKINDSTYEPWDYTKLQ